jgi:hypothetical protein
MTAVLARKQAEPLLAELLSRVKSHEDNSWPPRTRDAALLLMAQCLVEEAEASPEVVSQILETLVPSSISDIERHVFSETAAVRNAAVWACGHESEHAAQAPTRASRVLDRVLSLWLVALPMKIRFLPPPLLYKPISECPGRRGNEQIEQENAPACHS